MPLGKLRHLPPDDRVTFPSSHPEWEMPESFRHGRLCELIYQVLRGALGKKHIAGKDHFVYFDRRAPERCVAPDAFIKLGVRPYPITSWKTWERGVPELCIEILSPSDTEEKLTFREKLRRYAALGTPELISFRADGKPGRRLRAWDRTKGQLVQRIVSQERTPCRALGGFFVVHEEPEIGPALRLVDAKGDLVLTETDALAAKLRAEIDRLKRSRAKKR